MGYKFIEGLTKADVAFEARGKNLDKLFEYSALAVFDIMAEPKKVKKNIKQEVSIVKDSIENLLYSFLEEVIFLKDAEFMVFKESQVKVLEGNGNFVLNAVLFGDKIDYKTQELKVDPKAITMHKFKVNKDKSGFVAQVVVDI
jgi:SHS2 domain-containing protein